MAKTEEKVVSLEEMQKQMEKLMAEARKAQAEAEAMMEEARRLTGGEVRSAQRQQEIADSTARGEELVEIRLFKDSGKYKDDVFVGCNGETIAIKRGERVQIKRKFAEVLDNSERQDFATAQLITEKASQWARDQQNI